MVSRVGLSSRWSRFRLTTPRTGSDGSRNSSRRSHGGPVQAPPSRQVAVGSSRAASVPQLRRKCGPVPGRSTRYLSPSRSALICSSPLSARADFAPPRRHDRGREHERLPPQEGPAVRHRRHQGLRADRPRRAMPRSSKTNLRSPERTQQDGGGAADLLLFRGIPVTDSATSKTNCLQLALHK